MEQSSEAKKEYLKSYKQTLLAIELLQKEIDELKHDKMDPCIRNTGNFKGYDETGLSGYMALLDNKIKELQGQRYKKIQFYCDIIDLIDAVQDETERNLLRAKYIHCMTWEQVCECIGYSWRQNTVYIQKH